MPDGTTFPAKPESALRFRCDCCNTPTHLSDLNDDMLCVECGEASGDEDRQPSAGYLRRWEGAVSI